MLNETAKPPLTLWKPRFVGIITFLLLPGGWFLGILNFRRLGLKRQVVGHLIFFLCLTLVLLAIAFSGGDMPSFLALILGVSLGFYMSDANTKAINEYRAAGGVVQDADGVAGFFICLGATVGWFLLLLLLALPVVFFQVFILGAD